jgi:hypothetical protein
LVPEELLRQVVLEMMAGSLNSALPLELTRMEKQEVVGAVVDILQIIMLVEMAVLVGADPVILDTQQGVRQTLHHQ